MRGFWPICTPSIGWTREVVRVVALVATIPLLAGLPALGQARAENPPTTLAPSEPVQVLTAPKDLDPWKVALGKRLYRGRDAGYPAPPAQIRTCPLRHPAPPLGWTDGESAVRPRVSDFQPGPMGSGQSRDVSPCGAVLLRPAA